MPKSKKASRNLTRFAVSIPHTYHLFGLFSVVYLCISPALGVAFSSAGRGGAVHNMAHMAKHDSWARLDEMEDAGGENAGPNERFADRSTVGQLECGDWFID